MFLFQYTFTELTRNLILAGVSVFVVVLLFVVDLRSALYVVICVGFTMVSCCVQIKISDCVVVCT